MFVVCGLMFVVWWFGGLVFGGLVFGVLII